MIRTPEAQLVAVLLVGMLIFELALTTRLQQLIKLAVSNSPPASGA